MATFKYQAVNADNEPVEGTIDAASAHAAVAALREEGFQVNGIGEVGVSAGLPRIRQRLSWEDIALFNEQLLAITKSGLPLAGSLRAVARDLKSGRLRTVLEDVHRRLETGATLEEALGRHPISFPPVYLSLIRAGERTGNLPGVLSRLSAYAARMVETKHKLQEALAYPILVLVASFAVLGFLLVKIMPVYVGIYAEFNKPLPVVTRFWFGLGAFVRDHSTPALWVVAALVVALFLLKAFGRRSGRLALALDWLKLRLPLFGRLFAAVARARFSHTLGLLLSSQAPLPESLELAGAAAGNAVLVRAARQIAKDTSRGETIGKALANTKAFPHTFCWMVATGEERGDLETVLFNLADDCEREVARADALLAFMTGPVLILLLGAVILFMLISVYYPVVGIGEV